MLFGWFIFISFSYGINYVLATKHEAIPVHTVKAHKRSTGIAPLFLTLALGGGERSSSSFGRFNTITRPDKHTN